MQQGKYLRLSHFVPKNHPQVHPGMSEEVREMMPFLVERSPEGWMLTHQITQSLFWSIHHDYKRHKGVS